MALAHEEKAKKYHFTKWEKVRLRENKFIMYHWEFVDDSELVPQFPLENNREEKVLKLHWKHVI